MNAVEMRDLSKHYKRYKKEEGLAGSIRGLLHREYEVKKAVEHISLTISEGEMTGLIGPNGAGKTTLVKMMTGIIKPSGGKLSVLGYEPFWQENRFKEQYAVVMGQKSQLFFELTTEDTLRMFKEIYGLGERRYQENKHYFVRLLGVEDLMDVPVRTLSLGERMKMELMASLIHDPKIIFLDEPTIGLDAVAGRQVHRFLKEVNEERGTTILLTSHYMEDIRQLCGRSIVVNHGNKIYDGDTEHLFEKYQKNKRITVEWAGDHSISKADIRSRGGVLRKGDACKAVIEVPKEQSGEMLQYLMRLSPVDVSIEEEEIGTVVERIYREEAPERA